MVVFFKAKDSIERLGVGKNMVSSIRFWCQSFKLIDNKDGTMGTTEFGKNLYLMADGIRFRGYWFIMAFTLAAFFSPISSSLMGVGL